MRHDDAKQALMCRKEMKGNGVNINPSRMSF